MLYKTVLIGIYLLTATNCFTLKNAVKSVFPKQFGFEEDPTSFIRAMGDEIELIECPLGFHFSAKDLKCKFLGEPRKIDADYDVKSINQHCPLYFRGTIPNPMLCRSFINCWDGIGHITDCAAHLLYSRSSHRCEWPEDMPCCEYWEKTNSKYVM